MADLGHIQPAAGAAITGVKAQVSFDGGTTWQPATVTGSGTSYQASYTAPADSFVTLKVTATDAAGGQISETITSAYRTGTATPDRTGGLPARAARLVLTLIAVRLYVLYTPRHLE